MLADACKSSIIAMLIDEMSIQLGKRHLDIDIAEQNQDPDKKLSKRSQTSQDMAQINALALKRKSPSLVNLTRRPDLRTHSSKLHLIDDTTLTSLPFPPPAASKRLKQAHQEGPRLFQRNDLFKDESSLLFSDELNRATSNGTPSAESIDLYKQDMTMDGTSCTFGDDNLEDTLEESQDPIVLVEDYVTEAQSRETVFRKKSLANIKKRLRENSQGPSFAPNIASSEPEKVHFGRHPTLRFATLGTAELEAIFGKIPGSERLKYCTLCDKPLYEISSVLSNSEAGGMTQTANSSHVYQEFVCWGCIDAYEDVLQELHQAEQVRAAEKRTFKPYAASRSPSRLPRSFYTLSHGEMGGRHKQLDGFEESAHPLKKRKFSNDLIARLQRLSAISQPNNGNVERLAGWQERLKRTLNNVLTNAFAPNDQAQ